MGSERFELYLMQKGYLHRQLYRNLRTWKSHFAALRGHEPEWHEMPPRVQRVELAYNALTHLCARQKRLRPPIPPFGCPAGDAHSCARGGAVR